MGTNWKRAGGDSCISLVVGGFARCTKTFSVIGLISLDADFETIVDTDAVRKVA